MELIVKFLRLPVRDQRLLLSTLLLQGAIALGLRLLPFRMLKKALAKVAVRSNRANNVPQSLERILWALSVINRHTPLSGSCLIRALTVQVLFRKNGRPADLHIGVARNPHGQLEAHAWLECQGRIVLGQGELSRYTRLRSL